MEIIIGKNSGFCYGVKRAVEGTQEVLQKEKANVSCLGELVHNPIVMTDLIKQGLRVIEDVSGVSEKVIIRAHGASKEVYNYLQENQIEYYDYTCPNVMKIHEIVADYANKDFFVFLFGSDKHPETIASKSFCYHNYFVIEKHEEIEAALECFYKSGKSKLLIISQTTYSESMFEEGVQSIQKLLLPNIELVIKNTICSTTQMRQKETKEIAKKVDFMIIIGGKNSSNTQKLFEIAKTDCPKSICVEGAQELAEISFNNVEYVGIMAGASTAQKSIDEVVNFLQKYVQN